MSEIPTVLMSTESKLKHDSIASQMARVGIYVRVEGVKVDSGVSEQPRSLEETYQGAMNRQRALHETGRVADYYATIESGQCRPIEGAGMYACNVVIIEPADQEPHVGFSIDIALPQEMVEVIPSIYPDAGVWAQEVHGATEKDPYPYLTDGRLTRRDTTDEAVHKVAIMLSRSGS